MTVMQHATTKKPIPIVRLWVKLVTNVRVKPVNNAVYVRNAVLVRPSPARILPVVRDKRVTLVVPTYVRITRTVLPVGSIKTCPVQHARPATKLSANRRLAV